MKALLEEGKDIRLGDWKAADIEILNSFQLLTAKPVVYLVMFSLPSRNLFDFGVQKSLLFIMYKLVLSNACWILFQIKIPHHVNLASSVFSVLIMALSFLLVGMKMEE